MIGPLITKLEFCVSVIQEKKADLADKESYMFSILDQMYELQDEFTQRDSDDYNAMLDDHDKIL